MPNHLGRYYGCCDRHCPQCQGRATRQWAEQQRDHLLAVPYYHLVFTLPHQLNGWVQLHLEVIYRLLFQATWQTLKAFAEDPKRLGGQLGMTAILHTWGQTLSQHVHLHCLVPGGVLTANGRWQATRGTYLKLAQFRAALAMPISVASTEGATERSGLAVVYDDLARCPRCRVGRMRVKRQLPDALCRWRTRG